MITTLFAVRRASLASFALATCVLLFAAPAKADPLPGEVAKFMQLPLNGGLPTSLTPGTIIPGGAPYPGHDELSTAYVAPVGSPFQLQGNYMADDFADNVSTPVVHVQWWGSYINPNAAVPPGQVQQFLISFESDVPASTANGPSHPGSPLLSQIVTLGALSAGSGTFTEKAIPTAPGATEQLFQYNAELTVPFLEQKDTVYWLKIVALDNNHQQNDPNALVWGWHDRDWGINNPLASPVPVPGETPQLPNFLNTPIWHFQDDSVSGRVGINPLVPGPLASIQQFGAAPQNYIDGIDGPFAPTGGPGISNFSKDLAFVLYTTPEPSSLCLAGMGLGFVTALVLRRRYRM